MTLGITTTLIQLWALNAIMAYSAYLGTTSGTFSLAYVAFIGLGGYTAAILATEQDFSILESMVVACVVCSVVALVLVRPFERLGGVYLAIVSVAVVGLFQILLINLDGVTKGAIGIAGLPLVVGTWTLLLALVLVTLAVRQVERSDIGRAIRMTRSDSTVAGALGVNVGRVRLWLFVASAFVAAIAGVLQAYYFGYVSPEAYSFDLVITLLAMVVIGGLGHWSGPLVGAAIFTMLPDWLQSASDWSQLITGALLLMVVIVSRDGVVGTVRHGWYLWRRRVARRSASQAEPASPERGDAGAVRDRAEDGSRA